MHKVLREEFRDGHSFFALRRDFIEGRIFGKSWFSIEEVWQSYLRLNEAIFDLGFSPTDFIPQNYIVTPSNAVYFIDADKVRKIKPKELNDERSLMLSIPTNHFRRAIFDVERWVLTRFRNTLFPSKYQSPYSIQ
jgi:hypothetical protein